MEVVSLFYRSRDRAIFNLELFVNHGARGNSYIATLSQKEEMVIENLRGEEDALLFEEFIWASLQRVRDYIEFKDFESFSHGRRQ